MFDKERENTFLVHLLKGVTFHTLKNAANASGFRLFLFRKHTLPSLLKLYKANDVS